MRYSTLTFGAVFLAVSSVVVYCLTKADGPGLTKSEETNIRQITVVLGSLSPGEVTRKVVSLRNDSSKSWTAALVHSDCSCVVQSLDPELIEPGCQGTLTLNFTAPNRVGAIGRKILVEFREEAAPHFVIKLDGVVEPWCHATPRELSFVRIPGATDKDSKRRVLLNLRRGAHLRTDRISAPDWLQARFSDEPRRPGAEDSTVVVEVTPRIQEDSPAGILEGSVVFTSADNPADQCELAVRVRVESALTPTPSSLFLGTRNVGEEFTEQITLRGFALSGRIEQSFLNRAIHTTHDLGDHLTVETVPSQEPDELKVRCHFQMPVSPCFVSGKVVVACQGRGSVSIPVSSKVVDSNSPGE